MAFMSQKRKKELAPAIKAVLKKFGIKGTLAVDNHSSLVANLKSGDIDFENSVNAKHESLLGGPTIFHTNVNTYWIEDHWTGKAKEFLLELKAAMSRGNHDNSDIMTDYFDVGWYVNINIGKWDKAYEFSGKAERPTREKLTPVLNAGGGVIGWDKITESG